MPRRNPMLRVLAAGATFTIGALVVGVLTFLPDANAEKPEPAPAPAQVASLTPAEQAPPPKVEAKKAEAPRPRSHARKFLPVQSFGGY